MFPNVLPLEPANVEVKPFMGQVLFTHGDFFAMFDAPFEHGGGWDRAMDERAARVVVLSKDLNDKLFGGENSVGRTLRAGGEDFTVTGVLRRWNPQPKFYEPSSRRLQRRRGDVHALRDRHRARAAVVQQQQLLVRSGQRLQGLAGVRVHLDGLLGRARGQRRRGALPRLPRRLPGRADQARALGAAAEQSPVHGRRSSSRPSAWCRATRRPSCGWRSRSWSCA